MEVLGWVSGAATWSILLIAYAAVPYRISRPPLLLVILVQLVANVLNEPVDIDRYRLL